MRSLSLGRSSSILRALPLVALLGCAPNTMEVRSSAPGARVLLDGRETPLAEPRPLPYFGTYVADLDPDEGPRGDWVRSRTRTAREIAAPVPGWLFPLDFFGEAFHRLWHGPAAHVLSLDAALVPGTVVEVAPPRLPELLERAQAARSAR